MLTQNALIAALLGAATAVPAHAEG